MNLSFYNILSHLIPGFLVYLTIFTKLDLDSKMLEVLPATAISYTIGFFINSVAAWFERFYFWTWGGLPSSRLLEGKACGRISFTEWKKIKTLLQKEAGMAKVDNRKLFGIAMRIANNEGRIEEMNAQYAFARAMLTGVLIGGSIVLISNIWSLSLCGIIITLSLVTWYRTKERGYYYAKEVLTVALNRLD